MRTFRKKVPYWRSLSYAFADFYFSAITPSATGGQPMQLYYMVRDGFGAAHSSFSLLATAAAYQMTVLVYGCIMIGTNLTFVMGQGRIIRLLLIFGVLVNGFCSGLILLIILNGLLAEKTMLFMVGGLCRTGIIKNRKRAVQKVEGLIDEYSRGGAYLRQYPLVHTWSPSADCPLYGAVLCLPGPGHIRGSRTIPGSPGHIEPGGNSSSPSRLRGGFRGRFPCAVPHPFGGRTELFRDALKPWNQLLRNALRQRSGDCLSAVCKKGKGCFRSMKTQAEIKNRGLPDTMGSSLCCYQR